ncbi:MAG: Maf family protein [Nanoarchaeota archaeon]|nr:Maf family protein [Nanoarchaeota archaeon]
MKNKIILASSSPQRKALLEQIGLEFETMPSSYEENMQQETGHKKLAMELAYGKARDVAEKTKEGLVIGADTFIALGDERLGKPKNDEDARLMLKKVSGKTLEIYSGIAIIDSATKKSVTDYEVTKVKMKEMSDEEINAYIKTKEPINKAGACAIEGIGAMFIERIEGCYSNIVGLPLYRLCRNLEKFGLNAILKNKKINKTQMR